MEQTKKSFICLTCTWKQTEGKIFSSKCSSSPQTPSLALTFTLSHFSLSPSLALTLYLSFPHSLSHKFPSLSLSLTLSISMSLSVSLSLSLTLPLILCHSHSLILSFSLILTLSLSHFLSIFISLTLRNKCSRKRTSSLICVDCVHPKNVSLKKMLQKSENFHHRRSKLVEAPILEVYTVKSNEHFRIVATCLQQLLFWSPNFKFF